MGEATNTFWKHQIFPTQPTKKTLSCTAKGLVPVGRRRMSRVHTRLLLSGCYSLVFFSTHGNRSGAKQQNVPKKMSKNCYTTKKQNMQVLPLFFAEHSVVPIEVFFFRVERLFLFQYIFFLGRKR